MEKKKYLVTVTESITVWAQNVEEAHAIAQDAFQFYGAETTNSEVEVVEVEDEPGPNDAYARRSSTHLHIDLGERRPDGTARPAYERWPNGAPT